MRIKEIIKEGHQNINKLSKNKSKRGENLSFSGIEELMRHRSYKRVKGALRQK